MDKLEILSEETSTENVVEIDDAEKHKYHCGHYDQDDTYLANSDNVEFFACGREYANSTVNHKYTEQEKKELLKYDSLDYLPPWSDSYKSWLSKQSSKLEWDRWIVMGMIGFTVGLVGFLLHQLIDLISHTKWFYATKFLEEGLGVAWLFSVGYSLIFLIPAAALVVWYRSSAGGSGIPELIGFLNGTFVHHIFNIRTMAVKFISSVFAIGAGMPAGPEGPMIHMGGLIGAGISQFKSDSLGINLRYFNRFRNSKDRRNFISAGVAAGVSSSFGAPIGGFLFSMEEVSSFWSLKLSWQTFFCCMLATFTTELFNSAFTEFSYDGFFGLFDINGTIVFQVDSVLPSHILVFLPTIVLGLIGGSLGGLFTFLNIKIARFRRKFLIRFKNKTRKKIVRLMEPCIIMFIYATISILLPAAFRCTENECHQNKISKKSENCLTYRIEEHYPPRTETDVRLYTCPTGKSWSYGNITINNKTYNQVATLLFVNGEHAIKHLFSNGTHNQFDFTSLITVLIIYYILACWTAGTSIASGLVVPMLFIGGLYGRIIGQAMVLWFGIHPPDTQPIWSWIDPGAMAVIGAASFFGGVSRQTMSLTVIMVEITNDISFLLPIMLSIMISKWVGDYLTHPLYHSLLEFKCIPYLDAEPIVYDVKKKPINLEFFCASDVMATPVVTLSSNQNVAKLCEILLTTNHGGFPIVKKTEKGPVFGGTINRLELCELLQRENLFKSETASQDTAIDNHIPFSEIHMDKLSKCCKKYDKIQRYLNNEFYADKFIDLTAYINRSCVTLPQTFSLHRTYIIFRTLGLRHLPIVDETNNVVGIITRKDLMGYKLEEKIQQKLATELH